MTNFEEMIDEDDIEEAMSRLSGWVSWFRQEVIEQFREWYESDAYDTNEIKAKYGTDRINNILAHAYLYAEDVLETLEIFEREIDEIAG